MYRIRLVFRRFLKGITLRSVNILGLSVIFTCLLISAVFIHRELTFDRFHSKADRIVRLQVDGEGVHFGARVINEGMEKLPEAIPEIERMVSLLKINTAVVECGADKQSVNDVYYASPDFFDLFDFHLVEGDTATALKSPDNVILSRHMAALLFGEEQALGKTVRIFGRKAVPKELTVTGIFEDMPANSHFHTDILISNPDLYAGLAYVYLLLPEHTALQEAAKKIENVLKKAPGDETRQLSVTLMPLTDIHLYGHESGEMEVNGDIKYVYLLISSNLLLLVVVLFNLWLNSKVIFLNNRKYYQLVKLNGASSGVVFADEFALAAVSCCPAIGLGFGLAFYVASLFDLSFIPFLRTDWFVGLSVVFILLILAVSVLPVVVWFSSRALSSASSLLPKVVHFGGMKYMLVVQYAVVIAVLILTTGISRQIELIKTLQPGGEERHILVMEEQSGKVVERFDLLKEELLKHPEFTDVTAASSLPGGTSKDAVEVVRYGSDEKIVLSTMVVDPDFFSFYKLKTLAGTTVLNYPYTLATEQEKMAVFFAGRQDLSLSEQYVINESALKLLGFSSPEEAVGKALKIVSPNLGFIPQGTVAGVVADFAYANVREKVTPLIAMCRKSYMQCFMVRCEPETEARAMAVFNRAWNKVNPDYPAAYSMLQDVYGHIYQNELGAERLLGYFSVLCLLIANIGLAVFLAFIIRKRKKEIGIRKVNGAGVFNIVWMLQWDFLKWIGLAFVIAVPLAYGAMQHWLEGFSYKIVIGWWIFAVAGLITLMVAMFSVGWQTCRAATENPVKALKSE